MIRRTYKSRGKLPPKPVPPPKPPDARRAVRPG